MKNKPDPKKAVIEAAGGLLWREMPNGLQLGLIHRPSLDDWTLPKGKRKPDESWQETALREVWEETAIRAELETFAGSVAYLVEGIPKVVLFWNMRVVGESDFIPNKEVDQLIWVSLDQALELVSYPDEIALILANQPDSL